jgi:hypothetical protein
MEGPQRFPRIRRKLHAGKAASMHGEAVLERAEGDCVGRQLQDDCQAI